MKVVIAEDESIIRQAIINKINWDELELTLAGEAENGEQALELMKHGQPDILITDIRMPFMDGLSLIREVVSRYPDIYSIIVTSFSDFDYAREAVSYGVKHYLLKPIDEQELNQRLRELIERKKQEDQRQGYIHMLEQRVMEKHDELYDLSLSRFIIGEGDHKLSSILVDGFTEAISRGRMRVVVLELDPIAYPVKNFQAEDEPLIWFGIRNIVEECLGNAAVAAVVFRHAMQMRHLVIIQEWHSLNGWIQEALDNLNNLLCLQLTAGVGMVVEQEQHLSKSYEDAVRVLKRRVLHGSGRLYGDDSIRSIHIELTEEEKRLLANCLTNGNKEELYDLLESILQNIVKQPSATFEQFRKVCLDIIRVLDITADLTETPDPADYLERILEWKDALNYLYRIGEKAIERKLRHSQKTGKNIVEEVGAYIETHYHEDISLNWVSETYFIHANYFARLFKERFGKTLSDYLTNVRMQRALELLQRPPLSIREIAQWVGYEDPSYFTIVFRKHYGETPSKYREKL